MTRNRTQLPSPLSPLTRVSAWLADIDDWDADDADVFVAAVGRDEQAAAEPRRLPSAG